MTIRTHDLFSVLVIDIGCATSYRELRHHGWLEGRIVWISHGAMLAARDLVWLVGFGGRWPA